jgi:cyclic pyranopterin phosphate synthase
MSKRDFSHVDARGNARMVDVSDKAVSYRLATARARVRLPPAVCQAIGDGELDTRKGPVLETARIAGVGGAKQTAQLIPFCHPLAVEKCDLDISIEGDCVEIQCSVAMHGRTGVEMEALTGASVAALTIYDMCKAISHDIVIESVELLRKSGGRSGDIDRTGGD